jgi:predicted glycosyltransferase
MFYSHNGVGVGHLRRQARLAAAFRERRPDAALLLATGSHAAGAFPMPPGVEVVALPSIRMLDRYETWEPRAPGASISEVMQMRSRLLLRTVQSFRPDLLVADFLPAGPYGELLDALAELGSQGGRAVAGFREIIDAPVFVRDLWARTGIYEVLREHYEAICVYGMPEIVDFERDYGLAGELAGRLRYVGYLGHPPRPRSLDDGSGAPATIVASTGGGVDGGALLATFITAVCSVPGAAASGRRVAVGGPLLSERELEGLKQQARGTDIVVERFVAQLGRLIGGAELVVTMPGYNTVCELLSSSARAIVVPRSGPSHEQRLRAAQLARWGRAVALEPDDLSPAALAGAIEETLALPAPEPPPVPLDGVARTVKLLERIVLGAPEPAR